MDQSKPIDVELEPQAASRSSEPHASEDVGVRERMPIVEESLLVDKVEVDQGGYRISKRVDVEQQLVDELLRHERVSIERRPVGRALRRTEVPEARYEGDTLILPVVEEVVVTEKRLMLVEEVCITRVRGTRREQRSVSLRKERVEIERLGADIQVIKSS